MKKYNNNYETWMAIQPLSGKNGSGYDRGSIFRICPPWMSAKKDGTDYTAKPYLTVTPVEQFYQDKGYTQPHVYPYGSSVFKMFTKIKNERNWFIKLCEHDLNWHTPTDLEATCKKCRKIYIVKKIGKGAHTCDSLAQEALSFRNQFGMRYA